MNIVRTSAVAAFTAVFALAVAFAAAGGVSLAAAQSLAGNAAPGAAAPVVFMEFSAAGRGPGRAAPRRCVAADGNAAFMCAHSNGAGDAVDFVLIGRFSAKKAGNAFDKTGLSAVSFLFSINKKGRERQDFENFILDGKKTSGIRVESYKTTAASDGGEKKESLNFPEYFGEFIWGFFGGGREPVPAVPAVPPPPSDAVETPRAPGEGVAALRGQIDALKIQNQELAGKNDRIESALKEKIQEIESIKNRHEEYKSKNPEAKGFSGFVFNAARGVEGLYDDVVSGFREYDVVIVSVLLAFLIFCLVLAALLIREYKSLPVGDGGVRADENGLTELAESLERIFQASAVVDCESDGTGAGRSDPRRNIRRSAILKTNQFINEKNKYEELKRRYDLLEADVRRLDKEGRATADEALTAAAEKLDRLAVCADFIGDAADLAALRARCRSVAGDGDDDGGDDDGAAGGLFDRVLDRAVENARRLEAATALLERTGVPADAIGDEGDRDRVEGVLRELDVYRECGRKLSDFFRSDVDRLAQNVDAALSVVEIACAKVGGDAFNGVDDVLKIRDALEALGREFGYVCDWRDFSLEDLGRRVALERKRLDDASRDVEAMRAADRAWRAAVQAAFADVADVDWRRPEQAAALAAVVRDGRTLKREAVALNERTGRWRDALTGAFRGVEVLDFADERQPQSLAESVVDGRAKAARFAALEAAAVAAQNDAKNAAAVTGEVLRRHLIALPTETGAPDLASIERFFATEPGWLLALRCEGAAAMAILKRALAALQAAGRNDVVELLELGALPAALNDMLRTAAHMHAENRTDPAELWRRLVWPNLVNKTLHRIVRAEAILSAYFDDAPEFEEMRRASELMYRAARIFAKIGGGELATARPLAPPPESGTETIYAVDPRLTAVPEIARKVRRREALGGEFVVDVMSGGFYAEKQSARLVVVLFSPAQWDFEIGNV